MDSKVSRLWSGSSKKEINLILTALLTLLLFAGMLVAVV